MTFFRRTLQSNERKQAVTIISSHHTLWPFETKLLFLMFVCLLFFLFLSHPVLIYFISIHIMQQKIVSLVSVWLSSISVHYSCVAPIHSSHFNTLHPENTQFTKLDTVKSVQYIGTHTSVWKERRKGGC